MDTAITGVTMSVASPRDSYLSEQHEIDSALRRVLRSGSYIHGEEATAFEEEFARYLGVQYAVGTSSGTDALQLALRVCGIGPGDHVATVSHTATATITAIDLVGATSVLLDVDPDTYTMNPAELERLMQ